MFSLLRFFIISPSSNLKISASIIVVLPEPATALTAILPDLYSNTGFWSSRGVILVAF